LPRGETGNFAVVANAVIDEVFGLFWNVAMLVALISGRFYSRQVEKLFADIV
jgi:hypothetical protein